MKAILEFNLPEDQVEYEEARHAADYRRALDDVREFLRGQYKYVSEEQRLSAADTHGRFYEILQDNGVELV